MCEAGAVPVSLPPRIQFHSSQCQTDTQAAIAAEYLANGYLLGDNILQKAIDIDSEL